MLPAAEQAGSWVMSCGGGDFDSREMYELMKLHGIEFMPSVNLYSSQIVAQARPDEAEPTFQLTNLMLTRPVLDEKLLKSIAMEKRMSDRSNALADTVKMMRSDYSPRTLLHNASYYDRATPERIIKVWNDCFGDPTKFTYVITGNISKDSAIELCEKYIASLPKPKDGKKGGDRWTDNGERCMKGNKSRTVEMNLGVKKQIYHTRCMQNIREKEGGVYTINVTEETRTVPTSNYMITAEFTSTPDDAEKLKGKLIAEWDSMAREGVTQLEYDTVVRYLTKKMIEKGDDADEWSKADVNDFMRRMDKSGGRLDVTFLSKE